MSWSAFASLALLCALPLAADAGVPACQRNSPAHSLALVELYTSEGCSSCPPADRWLSTLSSRYGPENVVPLSLHVDYWDNLGWRDPFGQAAFSERQRLLTRLSGASTIYTPGVFAGLREFRGWRDTEAFERRLREINARPAQADIHVAMTPGAAGTLNAEATFKLPAGRSAEGLQGVLVLYEDGLVSSVQRGENSGATLRHDGVVRHWAPQLALAPGGAQTLRQTVRLGADWNPRKLGLAAFVQDTRTGEVLQAVRLPACAAAAS